MKQGIWTEYDEALIYSGKYTAEELAQIPTVAMWIQGEKGYFFTYTAEDVSETVEGSINYNKAENKGTITFPTIKDSPLSGQTVNFSMDSDDIMQFEYTYEGEKVTGHCTWLCENLDNWNTEITEEYWKELMAFYQTIAEEAGPDASIDWGDLDEPLTWNDEVAAGTRGKTRAIAIGTVISVGLKVLGALFEEEKPDPNVLINQKLDKITGKLDEVLAGQAKMMNQMNLRFDQMEAHFGEVNQRLIAIANKMKQQEAVTILNNRNTTYYNPLKVQNTSYFDDAYKLYEDNKSDLSKVSTTLGEYGKEWVDNNEQYLKLTWQYIDYLTTVQHSTYGTGMDKIYDGMTFDKYPWEHMGTDDRLNYRAYDAFMITKCLFMITLYATYADLSDIKKEGIYKNFTSNIDKLKGFCEFNVTNPDEFLVCQVPGAHFVMHKELQKYNYKGKNNEVPHPAIYSHMAVYRPEWHEAGSIKIDNPYELRSNLLRVQDALAIYKYYKSAVYSNSNFEWSDVFVSTDNKGAGAVYAKQPDNKTHGSIRFLLYDPDEKGGVEGQTDLWIGPVSGRSIDGAWDKFTVQLGISEAPENGKALWRVCNTYDYYAPIVEKHF